LFFQLLFLLKRAQVFVLVFVTYAYFESGWLSADFICKVLNAFSDLPVGLGRKPQ
jgi:hypothetical protein